jgi:hypothetical protein
LTVLEVLMAIALIGMLAAAVVGSNESMFHGIGDEPLEETLRRAVREARYQAVNVGRRTILTWDDKDRAFVISSSYGVEIERMKSDAKGKNDSITFASIQQELGAELKDGDPTTVPTDSIVFDSDRCSTPFIAEIHYAGKDTTARYDAFSNLRMELPKNK